MPKHYFFLCFFFLFYATNSQSISQNKKASLTFEQLSDSLAVINKKDKKYPFFLQLYLNKAKKEQHTEHLFEAYYKYSGYEPSAQKAHIYTDSLLLIAKKLPQVYYIRALQAKATNYYYEKDYINSLKYELQALNKINKETDSYAFYKSIYSIGLVYFHIQEYNKAYTYFNQARVYFQKSTDYSHVQGYFNSLYREAFALYYLNNYSESKNLIKNGLNKKKLLKADDAYKLSYFKYVLALNLYREKQYAESITLLEDQIDLIIANNDFANLATLYYYLGENYHELKNEEQAVFYFNQIDRIFKEQHYSSPEIKEAYTYLIKYYQQKNIPAKELFYTNRMIEVMQYLQSEYKSLSVSLHYNFDVSKLLSEKKRLENDLNSKNKGTMYMGVLGTMIIVILLIFATYNYRKRKQYVKNYHDLLQQRKSKNTSLNVAVHSKIPNVLEVVNDTNKNNSAKELNDKTINKLVPLFDAFEKKHDFLNNEVNLNYLALQWNTNRTYLSEFINVHKQKTFNDYVNSLRVSYFLDEAEQNKKWYKLKVQAIAEKLGFSSARSFSNAFLKETGMSPSFYIQKKKNETKNDVHL